MFNITEEIGIIRNFARVMAARTGSTHNLVVGLIAGLLSEKINGQTSRMYIAGLLHDIGGIGIFESIITEPLSLTEWPRDVEEMLYHPRVSYSMVKDFLKLDIPEIKEHHELYNGKGYPNRIARDDVSECGYILGISDKVEILARGVACNFNEITRTLREWKNNWFPSYIVDEAICLFEEDKSLLFDIQQLPSLEKRLFYFERTMDFSFLDMEEKNLFGFLSRAITLKHPYTSEHSERVATLSRNLGLRAGLNSKDLDELETAAYLHDIGKVIIPRGVLNKPASLTPHEVRIIKEHSLKTYEILNISKYTEHIAFIAASHHEAMDGSGYPLGLEREQIPLQSRIINLADIYDALLSTRAYREALSKKEAFTIMEREFKGRIDSDILGILKEEVGV